MTASTLPPLPESGPTDEVALLDEGKKATLSPPSATTSATEEGEVEEVNQAPKDGESATEPSAKRRRLRRPSPSSSQSGGAEPQDDEDSGTSPPARSAPLSISPLASRPPPTVNKPMSFGGPPIGAEPDSDEAEHR